MIIIELINKYDVNIIVILSQIHKAAQLSSGIPETAE